MLNAPPMVLGHGTHDLTEARQVNDLKDRSPAAWAKLFENYYDGMRRLARVSLRSNQEAEDVTATVFLRALTAIDSYTYRGRPFAAWLYKIARNIVKERRRKAARELNVGVLDESLELPQSTEKDPEAVIGRMHLLEGLAKLTAEQREVLELTYLAGFSVREAAEMLGKGQRTIYYVQNRGLARLKVHFEVQAPVS